MIFLMDDEKSFDQIQQLLLIKVLKKFRKLEIQRHAHNLIRNRPEPYY